MSRHRTLSSLIVTSVLALGAGRTAVAARCPNLMLVLDKTGSMADSPDGTLNPPSKWKLLQDATVALVTKYGDQVPFGVELFSSNGFSDQQCFADTMISVEPAHGTAPKITQIVKASMPDGGTNTAEAIRRARQDPAMKDAARGQFIVLITDGDPNCSVGEPQNSFNEIQMAAAQTPPVHTFVVGFDGSAGVNPANLNTMAKNGLEPIMGCTGQANSPCYYSASTAQKLTDAIDKIINQVVGGEFGTTMCDDSCYSAGCDPGYVCTTDEFNMMPHCVADPCAGVTNCPNGSYCRQGACVMACPKCQTGQVCQDGQCVADPCKGVVCMNTDVCNPKTGGCIPNPCINKTCKSPTVCDVVSGNCVDDQCHLVSCPMGTTCQAGGNCAATTGSGDTTGTGAGRHAVGCAVGPASGRSDSIIGLALALLALVGLALFSRRRV